MSQHVTSLTTCFFPASIFSRAWVSWTALDGLRRGLSHYVLKAVPLLTVHSLRFPYTPKYTLNCLPLGAREPLLPTFATNLIVVIYEENHYPRFPMYRLQETA